MFIDLLPLQKFLLKFYSHLGTQYIATWKAYVLFVAAKVTAMMITRIPRRHDQPNLDLERTRVREILTIVCLSPGAFTLNVLAAIVGIDS